MFLCESLNISLKRVVDSRTIVGFSARVAGIRILIFPMWHKICRSSITFDANLCSRAAGYSGYPRWADANRKCAPYVTHEAAKTATARVMTSKNFTENWTRRVFIRFGNTFGGESFRLSLQWVQQNLKVESNSASPARLLMHLKHPEGEVATKERCCDSMR